MRCYDVMIALEGSDEYVSFRSLGLVCLGWNFPSATPRTQFEEITGGDGDYDLSNGSRGEIGYDTVTGEIRVFAVSDSPEYEITETGRYNHSLFVNKYHGQRVKLQAACDPGYYRTGRIWIEEGANTSSHKEFTLNVAADPFRYAMQEKTVSISAAGIQTIPTPSLVSKSSAVSVTVQEGRFYGDSYFGDRVWTERYVVSIPVTPGKTYSITYEEEAYYDCSFTHSFYRDAALTDKIGTTFDSKDSDRIYISCVLYYAKISTTTIWGLKNIKLIESTAHDVVNEGRKVLIPTISATADCTVFASGRQINLSAGDSVLAWDFPLLYGSNLCSTIGSGTVTIKYREGLL